MAQQERELLSWSNMGKSARQYLCLKAGVSPFYAELEDLSKVPPEDLELIKMETDYMHKSLFALVP